MDFILGIIYNNQLFCSKTKRENLHWRKHTVSFQELICGGVKKEREDKYTRLVNDMNMNTHEV